MKEIRVPPSLPGGEPGAVLLARVDGALYATGASCSHYSAPLAEGVMSKDKMHVVCPWHNAAFDLRTGQPVRGPGLSAIPVYPVSEENGEITIAVPEVMSDFEMPKAARRCPDDGRLFLILGGGPAGVAGAEALRQGGFTGRIILLTQEPHLPYDRPVLSKNLGKAGEPGELALRDAAHFEALDVEVRLGVEVKALRAGDRTVVLSSREELRYDAALLATGSRPRELSVPGGGLPGVLPLRTPEDAQRIAAACGKGKEVLVVGSSFIGMELAATLRRRGCGVTVLGMESVPFERVLGKRVGEAIRGFFAEKGVHFEGPAVVSEVQRSPEGKMTVLLKSGKKLTGDAIVLGVGVQPNAEFVSGTDKAADGSVVTDEHLRCSAPGLFAAGDVATYRLPDGSLRRVEHWDVACSQGRVAGRCMVGGQDVFDQPPFFWTSLFGKNLRYVGNGAGYDDLIVDGDLKKLTFIAYYCKQNQVVAVATMGRDPAAVAAGELLRLGRMPSRAEVKAGQAGLDALAQRLRALSCA